MRTIAIEEHFSTPQYQAAMKKVTGQVSPPPHMAEAFKKLLDLGEGRLADMDAAGIGRGLLADENWANRVIADEPVN